MSKGIFKFVQINMKHLMYIIYLTFSEQVRKLLSEMDSELLEHLERQEMGDLLFCHRYKHSY